MTVLGLALLAVWLFLAGQSIGSTWRISGRRGRRSPVSKATVAAVVPARDEAPFVVRALASLAAQTYPVRVILVDDHSSDGTAALAAPYATVIEAPPLPPGWTGKLWAVSQGIANAGQPDYFLLTDADIVHAPDNLAGLLARAEEGSYDLVSYMATLRCESFAERVLIPAFVFFFFQLYSPAWVNNPRRRTAAAAGGCILIRRETLESIGGIASIRGELIDDCALARAVKRSGGRIWLGPSRQVESIRPYETFAEISRMISRTAFTQLRYSTVILAGTVVAMVFVYMLPPILTFAGSAYAAAAWLTMSIAFYPAVRFYRRNPLWAPLLPAIAAFYTGCTIASAIQYWRGAGGNWKGRASTIGLRPVDAPKPRDSSPQ